MERLSCGFAVIIALLTLTICHGQELLENPDFEDAFDGDDWVCIGCTLTQDDSDPHQGSYAGRVTARSDYWAGVSQYVGLELNTNYYFTIYYKSLNQFAAWARIELVVQVDYAEGDTEYRLIGDMPQYMIEQQWQKLGGDFYLDGRETTSIRLYVQVDDANIEYLVDTASLTAFYLSPTWKDEANQRIEDIRKNDITINLELDSSYNPADIQVELSQSSHAFPFGSAIVDAQIAGDSEYNEKYQDCYYSHFNWAVHENAMKWQSMESNQYEITYPDESTRRLNDRGIPLRGHCVYWGVEQFVPQWLLAMTGDEIYTEIDRRMEYLVPRYVGDIVHWDVNNEQLHGTFFEESSGDPWILSYMFHSARQHDPSVTLYLNDYDIVSSSRMTQAYVQLVFRIESDGADVGGLGIQSHLVGTPDINSIMKRLEVAAEAGKPLLITELDIEIEDRDARADGYDDVVTLYFADPNIDGVLLWGFSDNHHWRPNAALFEGDDFVPNAAGLRWQEMMFERWRTTATFTPSSNSETFGTRGFYGQYAVQVTNNGELIHNEEFYMAVGQSVTLDISLYICRLGHIINRNTARKHATIAAMNLSSACISTSDCDRASGAKPTAKGLPHNAPRNSYDNSYRVEPHVKFPACKVTTSISKILEENLKDVKYDRELCGKLSRALADKIRECAKSVADCDSFKVVTFVVIGEKGNATVALASRCVWNDRSDTRAEATFSNPYIYAVGVAYGLHHQ